MSSGHQRIKWRRNIAENFNRLSRVHERYRQTTDDSQTDDGRTTTYSEHEHEFTFAKRVHDVATSPLPPPYTPKVACLNFGMWGRVLDIINHAKF